MVYEHSAVCMCLCVTVTENTAGKTEAGREKKKGGWGWRRYIIHYVNTYFPHSSGAV